MFGLHEVPLANQCIITKNISIKLYLGAIRIERVMVLSETCYTGKIKERIIGESPCFVVIDGQQLHKTHNQVSDFINVIVQLNVD